MVRSKRKYQTAPCCIRRETKRSGNPRPAVIVFRNLGEARIRRHGVAPRRGFIGGGGGLNRPFLREGETRIRENGEKFPKGNRGCSRRGNGKVGVGGEGRRVNLFLADIIDLWKLQVHSEGGGEKPYAGWITGDLQGSFQSDPFRAELRTKEGQGRRSCNSNWH